MCFPLIGWEISRDLEEYVSWRDETMPINISSLALVMDEYKVTLERRFYRAYRQWE